MPADEGRSARSSSSVGAERAEASETLRLLQAALASSADGVIVVDAKGHPAFINDAARRLMRQTPSPEVPVPEQAHRFALRDAAGRPLAPEETPLGRAMRGEATIDYPFTLGTSCGEDLCLSCTANPVYDERGRLVGAVAVFRDVTQRQKATKELGLSEANYRSIFELANDAIFIHDPHTGAILDANRRACELYGYSREEMLRLHVGSLSSGEPPYSQNDALRRIRAASEGQPLVFEWLAKDRSGRLFWVEVNLKVADVNGQSRLLAMVRDITERKQTEEALRASAVLLRQFVENTPAAVAMFDRQMRYLLVSRRWLADYRLGDRDIIGLSHYEVFPDVPQEWREIHQRCLAGATERREADPFRRADGRVEWVRWQIQPWRDTEGEIGGIIMFTEVITERVRAEAEREQLLEEVERRAAELDTTLSSVADALIVYGPDGEVVRLNVPARDLFGFSPRQMALPPEQRWASLRAEGPDGRPLRDEELPPSKALRGETVRDAVLVLHPPTGRTIWVSASAAPIPGPEGGILGAVVTVRDITAQHEIEENRKDFLRMISHDLRQPLTVMMGMAQWLQRRLGRAGLVREATTAERIFTSGQRMTAMIQDLVELARLEAGQLELHPEPVDLLREVNDTTQRVGTLRDQRRLRVEAPDLLPPAMVDYRRLERALVNLVTNALQYSPPDQPVIIRLTGRDGEVVVSVIDRGPGIPPDEVPRLFERFYQVDTGKKGEGLGLGLYIARLIVEMHGGRIWVESVEGRGSTFSFSVPTSA